MEHYLSVISDAFEAGSVSLLEILRGLTYGFVVPLVKVIQDSRNRLCSS